MGYFQALPEPREGSIENIPHHLFKDNSKCPTQISHLIDIAWGM